MSARRVPEEANLVWFDIPRLCIMPHDADGTLDILEGFIPLLGNGVFQNDKGGLYVCVIF